MTDSRYDMDVVRTKEPIQIYSGPIRYVLGFAFNSRKSAVLMVEKKFGPEINIGKWNGVGGKVEEEETQEQAMTREFIEETGLNANWTHFGRMTGKDQKWVVDLFKGECESGDTRSHNDVGEDLYWEDLDCVQERGYYAQNVQTMVAHALYGEGYLFIQVEN